MVAGLTPSTVRNRIKARYSSIAEFYNVNVILPSHVLSRQLDGALYQGPCSLLRMRVPPHAPIHGRDSNRILACLATFFHSSVGIYVNGHVVTTFRTFSFEHPL